MKGKKLEILVLVIAFALLLTAAFFMFFYESQGEPIKKIVLVNRIFSLGFIVYIIYSYVLSTNLNGAIRDRDKTIGNLKDEIARKTKKLADRDAVISQQTLDLENLTNTKTTLEAEVEKLDKKLKEAKKELKEYQDKEEEEQTKNSAE